MKREPTRISIPTDAIERLGRRVDSINWPELVALSRSVARRRGAAITTLDVRDFREECARIVELVRAAHQRSDAADLFGFRDELPRACVPAQNDEPEDETGTE